MSRYYKRIHTDRDYPILPNWAMRGDAARDLWLDSVMRAPGLSAVDKLVAHGYLRHWNSAAGWTFVSQYTIAAESGLDRSNMNRNVKRLIDGGWLHVVKSDRPRGWTHTALRLPKGKTVVTKTTKSPDGSDGAKGKTVVIVRKNRGHGDPLTVRKGSTHTVCASADATAPTGGSLEVKEIKPVKSQAELDEQKRAYLLKVRDHGYQSAMAGHDTAAYRAAYARSSYRETQTAFDQGVADADTVQWLVNEHGVDVVGLSRVAAILRAGDAHGPADGETVIDAVRNGEFGPITPREMVGLLAEAGLPSASSSAA